MEANLYYLAKPYFKQTRYMIALIWKNLSFAVVLFCLNQSLLDLSLTLKSPMQLKMILNSWSS